LAVAQEQNRDETKPKVVNAVTLEVTPAQAEKLDLARSVGTLSLVLRNQVDKSVVTTEGSTKKNLLNRVDEPPVMAATAQQPVVKTEVKHVVRKSAARKPSVQSYEQVEVVRGATKTVEEFKPSVQ